MNEILATLYLSYKPISESESTEAALYFFFDALMDAGLADMYTCCETLIG